MKLLPMAMMEAQANNFCCSQGSNRKAKYTPNKVEPHKATQLARVICGAADQSAEIAVSASNIIMNFSRSANSSMSLHRLMIRRVEIQ